MNRKILIYIGLILIIGLVFNYTVSEKFSNQIPSKKKILITGLRAQILADFIAGKLNGTEWEIVAHVENQEPELSNGFSVIFGSIENKKQIEKTVGILGISGPYDLIIHNLHDPKIASGSILNINKNHNLKNQIEFINKLKYIVKPSSKIISFLTNLEEFSGLKNLNNPMGYFIKTQSIENYSNSIGFTTVKFPELSNIFEHLSNVFEFILTNDWAILTGREFYSMDINNKTPGFIFGNEQSTEPEITKQFKSFENPNENYYKSLHGQLAKKYNVGMNMISFFSNTKTFLISLIYKFVSAKHHIILFNLPDHKFIPTDRIVSTDTWKITNKQLVPDFKKILEKINGLTRLVYLAGFVNSNELAQFVSQIPKNILVVVDTTWNNFIYKPDKITEPTYRTKGTGRCYIKNIENTVSNGNGVGYKQFINFPNVITIDTITKIFGLTDIALGYSIANNELTGIINGLGIKLNSFNERAIIEKLDGLDIIKEKQFYSNQLNRFIQLLDELNLNYYLVNPITIKILLNKTDKTNLSIVKSNITPSNSNYIQIIPDANSIQIIIYLDNEIANKQNELIIKKLQIKP